MDKNAVVLTDGFKSYSKMKTCVKEHQVYVCQDSTEVSKVFPWVHTSISNAKRSLLGTHHSINDVYMQNYLDEFCYKFNRRYFGEKQFDRLLIAETDRPWY